MIGVRILAGPLRRSPVLDLLAESQRTDDAGRRAISLTRPALFSDGQEAAAWSSARMRLLQGRGPCASGVLPRRHGVAETSEDLALRPSVRLRLAARYFHRTLVLVLTSIGSHWLCMRQCLTCLRRTSNPRFCSRRCAAIKNNHLYPKRRPNGRCSRCRKPLTVHRGICDTCKARLEAWRVRNPNLSTLWTRRSRKFALDLIGLSLWWGEGTRNRNEHRNY